MNRRRSLYLAAIFLSSWILLAQTPAQRLAKWKPVDMPFDAGRLSANERKMIDRLVVACRLLDEVYWQQSDKAGYALYQSTKDAGLKRLLQIMGSRWDLLDQNRPFVGTEPMPPGHELFPRDLTRAQIEQYVQQHPAEKAADRKSVV